MNRLLLTLILLLPACIRAESFTIQSTATNTKCAVIYQLNSNGNWGAETYGAVGQYADDQHSKTLICFSTLGDTLDALQADADAAYQTLTVDSSIITKTIRANGLGAGEWIDVGFFALVRAWTEGTDTDGDPAAPVSWNYATATAWGTAGCNNTTTDRSGTVETISSGRGTTRISYGESGTFTIAVSGATTIGALRNIGVIIDTLAYSGTGDMHVSFWSDDYTTDSTYTPKITVYYTLTQYYCEILDPDAVGTTTQWTRSTGTTNYTLVNDDNDATYVYSASNGNKIDLYNIEATAIEAGSIIDSIVVWTRSKAASSGIGMRAMVRPASTNRYGATYYVTDAYANYSTCWATNPDNSSAWVVGDIAALQIGINGADDFPTNVYVSEAWAAVWWHSAPLSRINARATNAGTGVRGANDGTAISVRGSQ